ncbi:MAG: hypothetical protein ACJ8DZ_01270 [Allosphingosinicella sp.]
MPDGEALVWTGGRAVVAILLPADEGSPRPTFLDARTDDILEWPTHWMPLPAPPQAS